MEEQIRLAVIDIGSNTFHLLIAQTNGDTKFDIIYKCRDYVKLASGGKSFIDEESYGKGLEAMIKYAGITKQYGVRQVRAIGTAMMRKASNAQQFIREVEEASGITIEIIPGEKEARFISQGVQTCLPAVYLKKAVILDIGGGSVEFILMRNDQIENLYSFPIGIAILKSKFHHHEPIDSGEISSLNLFLEKTLQPVLQEIKAQQYNCLIGCSGSFEVLVDSLAIENHTWAKIDIPEARSFIQRIIKMNLLERIVFPGVPEERVDLIVVATLLVEFLLEYIGFEHLLFSPYAMKEGFMAEMIQDLGKGQAE